MRAGEGLPRGGLGRGGPGLADALWTWPWAGGSSGSQNKAQACRGPEGLSQSVGRSLSHTRRSHFLFTQQTPQDQGREASTTPGVAHNL